MEKTCKNCYHVHDDGCGLLHTVCVAKDRWEGMTEPVCSDCSHVEVVDNDTLFCSKDSCEYKEKGTKHDNGKPPVGLLFESFPRALKEVARVSGHGCKEYGRHNWDKLENGQERYLDAMCRHILDRAIEGDVSDETGLYHIAQAVWNGLAILELYLRGKDNA